MNPVVLTVDIGNSRAHWIRYAGGSPGEEGDFSTTETAVGFAPLLAGDSSGTKPDGVIACSVAPRTSEILQRAAAAAGIPCVFLTHENVGDLAIGTRTPEEIGPDRLANALGARLHFDPPFVIIDMGTAVTVDAVTRANGYEGGAIAPGLSMLSDYLSEKAALLPRIDLTRAVHRSGIGKTTREAMEIGCTRGFDGMIRELVETLSEQVESIDGTRAKVLATGGSFAWAKEGYIGTFPYYPRLSLEGLFTRVEDLLEPFFRSS